MSQLQSQSQSPSLLERQQQTNGLLQQLLKETSAQLYAGPDAANAETDQQLYDKYVQAKENLSTAPGYYRSAQRNYYVQTKGQQYYDSEMEKEYGAKADKAAKELEKQLNKGIASVQQLNSYLADGMKKSEYVYDLYETVQNENGALKDEVATSTNVTTTSDRMTYYDMDKYDRLKEKYDYLLIMFYGLVFILAVNMFMSIVKPSSVAAAPGMAVAAVTSESPSKAAIAKAAVLILILALFPRYVHYLWQRIVRLFGILSEMV